MAIDTILLSFCEDSESHGGNPQYAPPLLLEAIGKSKLAKERRQAARDAKKQKKMDQLQGKPSGAISSSAVNMSVSAGSVPPPAKF